MDIISPCPIASDIAGRMRDARADLTAAWLDRIAECVSMDAERIFPSEDLLDHVPILISGIADYIEDPHDEITGDEPVIDKAMELGALRFAQGFDANEILREYEILGSVLFSFMATVATEAGEACSARELLACAHRLFRATAIIGQVTTAHYLRILRERVGEREERLRRFNRMITHELKNRVGATLGAGQLLQEEWLRDEERVRFAGMVTDNAQAIQQVLENLIALSRVDGERRRQRHVQLGDVITEVFRQLREMAQARAVELRIAGDVPEIEVNAAATELCLSNYLSNAIRYSDASAPTRWVEVTAALEPVAAGSAAHDAERELVLRVRDNGLGVPERARDRLFERFFRAHGDDDEIAGTGLGLSLVKETAESLGGRAWAEFGEDRGSTFALALPCRRGPEDQLSCGAGDGARAAEPRRPGEARATASD